MSAQDYITESRIGEGNVVDDDVSAQPKLAALPSPPPDVTDAGSGITVEDEVEIAESLAERIAAVRSQHWTPNRAFALVVGADALGLAIPALFVGDGRFWLGATVIISLFLFHSAGMYRPRLHLSVLDEMPTLVSRVLMAGAAVAGIMAVTGFRSVLADYLSLLAAAVVFQLLFRTAAYRLVRMARGRGRVGHDALILGAGRTGTRIAETLVNEHDYGLRPIGFLDDDPLLSDLDGDVPHLGGVTDLPCVLRENSVSVLIIAFGSWNESMLVDVMRSSEQAGCEVFIVPRLFEIHGQPAMADHIGAIPVMRMRRPRLHAASWRVKRLFDIVASSTALALLSPLLAAIALAVRIEGGPGVLFRQVRVGLDGKHFELIKFRSLKPADEAESATHWNIGYDNRLGPVGKFLRRSSLDELPQLWNILKGEMTIVGPRPERPHFVEQFSNEHERYVHRHRVPSGLTGLAQVSGLRGDTSIADRARYDNFYIENWSLWLDIKIILGTVRQVIGARGR